MFKFSRWVMILGIIFFSNPLVWGDEALEWEFGSTGRMIPLLVQESFSEANPNAFIEDFDWEIQDGACVYKIESKGRIHLYHENGTLLQIDAQLE